MEKDPTLHYTVCVADTDANGVVYHGRYVEKVERSRNRVKNLAGFTFGMLARQYGIMLVVHRMEAVYHAPALLDDELRLKTRLQRCQPSRSVWVTDVMRGDELLASISIEIVALHVSTRQLVPHPPAFLDGLARYLDAAPASSATVRRTAGVGARTDEI
ncbi:MAG: thioesterase family protein [Sulfurifustaceae bacterium]